MFLSYVGSIFTIKSVLGFVFRSYYKTPLKLIIMHSIHVLKTVNLPRAFFAATAETKKMGEARSRSEETLKP